MSDQFKKFKKIKGFAGFQKDGDTGRLRSPLTSAREDGDTLSEAQALFPEVDFDTEEENAEARAKKIEQFMLAFQTLTERQKQIVFAVQLHGSQLAASKALSMRQDEISHTLAQIRKKILKHIHSQPDVPYDTEVPDIDSEEDIK